MNVATVATWQGHRDGGALVLKTYGDQVRLDHSLRMAKLLVGAVPAEAYESPEQRISEDFNIAMNETHKQLMLRQL